ncbi:hypothetical protein A2334_05765 [Candidatus Roizmanbacteria bacterium RIFOXYB2_FULL_38_10]|uniref:Major facilitator superfamily (MFS) profile domain-containing protein n=1 Tax=Candidatus Roizmanbacteria bacterium RIFOXYD1_FULL_38_12 TaxID=1802093 RepID=A0A1F7L0V5_9BACT|nr:MAG: hypothetical protein A3K47_02885 [Candidatus Roizmanbacteria bacterium RIFOXYA2_FULL_38_14]OGK63713.1 MAG: hypothetical protein A3K27_02885 [Candidatus Roizmanbacteria bacterium RIFOXYA1_FULL_37_12]OGK65559.1 MAG: hypothetical protein A3K38_02885 [Candidatus Roizmanbacteria bacterium RIFOXYB1_FULL_40_23]OGK68343.1 MAG: hypothetical protein A2334_05765 [Candidatus Roizmanbacteria bacterium RIFOXYB2_FULL_38_10]OGK69964.1 MAG: hypothetical protein A3K21_02890 [Candidatus Roizmanbacteria ba
MNKRSSLFIPFSYRDFRLAWIGFFISQIGTEMILIAINWQIYVITKSPLSLGIIGMARFLPVLMFALFAGLFADLVNRKKLIFVSQLVLIISTSYLAFLTFTHHINPLLIYLLVAINSTAYTFTSPARQALLPHLVPRKHFMQAVSLNSLMWQLSVIIGPMIGGFIIGYLGIPLVYTIGVFAFMSVNITMLLLKPIPVNTNNTTFGLKSVREGLGFVKRSPLIWSTMLLDFFATFFASSMTLMPIFAKDILNVGPQGLGILYAAPSVGAVVAGCVFSLFHNVQRQGKILLVSVFIYGVVTIFFGFSRLFPFSLVCLTIAGACDMISSVIRNTMRQLITPDHLRGRMTSVNMIFYLGGPQLGEVEAGVAATLFGTPMSVVLGGIGTMVITTIMAYVVPTLRRYDNHKEIA